MYVSWVMLWMSCICHECMSCMSWVYVIYVSWVHNRYHVCVMSTCVSLRDSCAPIRHIILIFVIILNCELTGGPGGPGFPLQISYKQPNRVTMRIIISYPPSSTSKTPIPGVRSDGFDSMISIRLYRFFNSSAFPVFGWSLVISISFVRPK